MNRMTAVAAALIGLASLTTQPAAAQRHGRIEVPRVQVDVPAINILIPAISVNVPRIRVDDGVRVDIPPIQVDIPEIPINTPAFNFRTEGFHIDLSNLGRDIEAAIQDAMSELDDFDRRHSPALEISRVEELRRDWRKAVRRARTTGDWDEADAIARQLTRAADRLKR